jgi:hypothetical protein
MDTNHRARRAVVIAVSVLLRFFDAVSRFYVSLRHCNVTARAAFGLKQAVSYRYFPDRAAVGCEPERLLLGC